MVRDDHEVFIRRQENGNDAWNTRYMANGTEGSRLGMADSHCNSDYICRLLRTFYWIGDNLACNGLGVS